MSRKVLVPIILLVLMLILAAGAVSAGNAMVYGKEDGFMCGFSYHGNIYSGPAMVVLVDGVEDGQRTADYDGKIQMHCHATTNNNGQASRSTQVTKVVKMNLSVGTAWGPITCKVLVTPSGNANFSCPSQLPG